MPSHFSGVVTITWAFVITLKSGVTSPVSSATFLSSFSSSLTFQSLILSLTRAFRGAMYTTLDEGLTLKMRNMAISAAMVLPEPVGAPSSTL
uniref:Secreted protein n=1 Tax=Ixodes ricinus TaxID=34613 RepID=A0A6B0UH61_IXORI